LFLPVAITICHNDCVILMPQLIPHPALLKLLKTVGAKGERFVRDSEIYTVQQVCSLCISPLAIKTQINQSISLMIRKHRFKVSADTVTAGTIQELRRNE